MANAGRKLPYVFLLLVALAAGVLSVVVLQKVREQRVFARRLQERDRQLVTLRILLQVCSRPWIAHPSLLLPVACTCHCLVCFKKESGSEAAISNLVVAVCI